MNVQRLCTTLALFVVFSFACSSPAQADPIVRDTFDDGSVSDGTPATWTVVLPQFPGTLDAASGDLIMTPSSRAIVASIAELEREDVSIRAQARILESSPSGSGVELLARGDRATVDAYLAGLDDEGFAYVGRSGDDLPAFASTNTDLRLLEEDVILQFDVFGTELSMWAWKAGEPMPTEPLLSATDGSLTSGEFGFDYFAYEPTSPLGSAVYRYVHVASTHIPEPSTVLLAVLLLICSIARMHRVGRPQRSL